MKRIISVIVIITAVLSTSIVARADESIANYTKAYDNLCNVKLADNMSADMPHGKINIEMNNTKAVLSSSGITFINRRETIELKIAKEASSVNLIYAF